VNPSQVYEPLNPKSLNAMKDMEMAYFRFEPQENCFYAWRWLRVIDIEILDRHSNLDPLAFAAIVAGVLRSSYACSVSMGAFSIDTGVCQFAS